MGSKADKPRVIRRPEKSQQQAVNGRRKSSWIASLLLLFLAVAACGVASLLLYNRWLGVEQERDRIQIEGGNPELGATERLYLESYLISQVEALEGPAGLAAAPVAFVISPGEPASQIAANMRAAGILQDDELFVNYLRYHGLDATLAAGTYQLDPALTVPELARLMSNPYQGITLNFLPGWRLEQMTAYLAATTPGNVEAEEFQAIVERRQTFSLAPYDFLVGHPAGASLEGYLFPDTYQITVEMPAAALVDMMLNRFGEKVTPAMRQSYGVQGLTLREALTLASIVERETPFDEERRAIAAVFHNRLAQNMPLQADSTVQYELGYDVTTGRWWKSPLSQDDLAIGSQYNTYQIPGLPPGPIANPGEVSLQAVANPEVNDYLFFVLDCNTESGHLFSVTFEEHLRNVERCLES